MILIEITAAVDDGGTLQTFYVSTDAFVSSPVDTPANTSFIPALIDPGSFGISAFGDGKTGGGTQLTTGEILLANTDGGFDLWKDYSFDGRPITIRSGNPSLGYPSSCPILFTGTVETVECSWTQVSIRLKDKQFVFQVPLLPNFFGGTNSLPNGLDGTANDIKGQPKPRVYGKVYNIAPSMVNTSLQTFQVSDRAVNDIPAVYDRGVALTKGTNYGTSASLQGATGLTAGYYYTCFAEGYFRVASAPAGNITCDVVEGANAAARTSAQILKKMAMDAGVSGISSADVTAMDLVNSSEVGIYIDDNSTFQAAMDQIANSAGAYYGFDAPGVLRMAILSLPTGTPVLSLDESTILPGIERRPVSGGSIPPYAVNVQYQKIYTVQDSDIGGSVSQAFRAFLAEEYRSVRVESNTIRNKYLLADQMWVNTLLVDAGAAATEAVRLLALNGTKREIWDVPVPLDIIAGASPSMLSVVSLTIGRYGMSTGRLFRVIGVNMELSSAQAIISLWG